MLKWPAHRNLAKLLPTPTVQDAHNNASPSQLRRHAKALNVVAGGRLNPRWVEWLMGWPIGWVSCDSLAMDKYRSWQRQHSST